MIMRKHIREKTGSVRKKKMHRDHATYAQPKGYVAKHNSYASFAEFRFTEANTLNNTI
ncbi:unnamed protein product [Larinioides sclopetarius]|uniref:Uncharacterized protein n=1 Tax=Larinioides sclopetarius TaxID=280406 RepID=A0AAV1ZGH9_9ARAC